MLYGFVRAGLLSVMLVACGGSDIATKRANGTGESIVQDDTPPTHRRSVGPDEDEDGEDDGFEVEGTRGKLHPQDIQQALAPHGRALADCYHSRIAGLRYVGGQLSLRYVVARDGSVKQVQVEKSDVGAWPVEKCLIDLGHQIGFQKPKGGEAEFSVPLDFSPTRGANWWDEQRADQEVGDLVASLDECGAASNVWVTLYVANRGVVSSVGFASPSKVALTAEWAICAEAKIKTWTLSDPRGRPAKLSFRYKPE